MQVALVGLSQSGKSTLFSAMTGGTHAQHTASPTQADKAVVHVPDQRLDSLSAIYKPKKTTHANIEFLDMPGVSFTDEPGRAESRRTVAQARQADMLVYVVRAFHNDSVMTYRDRVDPAADLDELQTELLLADLEQVTNRIEKLEKSVNKPTKTQDQDKRELALQRRCAQAIEAMNPISAAIETPEEEKILRSFGFLTLKPACVVVNVDEDAINKPSPIADTSEDTPVITLAATIEAELAALDPDERDVFLQDMNITTIARDRLIQSCYNALKVISFLTVGDDEVRAWTIPNDCPAVDAAGAIHSDIQRGFIRAETVSYDDFIAAGDMKAAKAAGHVRLEGKNYPVKDGDIINFRFNV